MVFQFKQTNSIFDRLRLQSLTGKRNVSDEYLYLDRYFPGKQITIPKTMIKPQILEAIKQMQNVERLEIIEFALRLVREEMEKTENLSLKEAAEVMRPYYAEGSNLTEFVDVGNEDFYEYNDYV